MRNKSVILHTPSPTSWSLEIWDAQFRPHVRDNIRLKISSCRQCSFYIETPPESTQTSSCFSVKEEVRSLHRGEKAQELDSLGRRQRAELPTASISLDHTEERWFRIALHAAMDVVASFSLSFDVQHNLSFGLAKSAVHATMMMTRLVILSAMHVCLSDLGQPRRDTLHAHDNKCKTNSFGGTAQCRRKTVTFHARSKTH